MDWINEAVENGAKLLTGGNKKSSSVIEPTVLAGASAESNVMREEIFGPVVVINKIKNLEDGIRLANDVPFAFQSAIFTKNIDRAFKAARLLKATTVLVNDSTTLRADWMPFAGGGVSGLGVGGVPYSVKDMTREKLLIIKTEG
jgi:acyl-CoA reductase-like NAD-dependent aldehyde dehydrogenase